MMHQVYKTLPDDKPITAICVVEDISKCPPGFYVVSRTHDQDSDADLWRENSFFGRKFTRYLCISKTEGIGDYIVEFVKVITEKEMPSDGYCLIARTIDSEQKAWRKKQLCYRLTRHTLAVSKITDIIVLSRAKKAPDGFRLAGGFHDHLAYLVHFPLIHNPRDINGMSLCFKSEVSTPTATPQQQLRYSLSPQGNGELRPAPPPPTPPTNGVEYPNIESPSSNDYENLVRVPVRPAPPRPPPANSTYATIASYQGLEGIPFVLHPKMSDASTANTPQFPEIKAKTKYQIDQEYEYDFRLERDIKT